MHKVIAREKRRPYEVTLTLDCGHAKTLNSKTLPGRTKVGEETCCAVCDTSPQPVSPDQKPARGLCSCGSRGPAMHECKRCGKRFV